MLRHFAFAALALASLPTWADDTKVVQIGTTNIKLSLPKDMLDIPSDDPMAKAAQNLVPPDCIPLRDCISAFALDPTKPDDPSQDVMSSHVYALKDAPMDIDSGIFIDFVEDTARKAMHGVFESKDVAFDYDAMQQRLDKFKEATGVNLQIDSDVYSLGMVSRSVACVSYMNAQYVNETYKGKTVRVKCVSVVAYIRLQKKVVVVATCLNKNTILQDELRTLKHAAEHYQCDLQLLNN
jgi:hypothetical protein